MAPSSIENYVPAAVATKSSVAHPLCPLTATEITTTADLVRSAWPANTDLRFKVLTLDEPPKKDLLPYLEAEHSGASLPHIDRKAFISYYIRNTVRISRLHPDSVLICGLGPFSRGRGEPDITDR